MALIHARPASFPIFLGKDGPRIDADKVTIDLAKVDADKVGGANIGILSGYDLNTDATINDFTLKIGGSAATFKSEAGGVARFELGTDKYDYTLATGALVKAS